MCRAASKPPPMGRTSSVLIADGFMMLADAVPFEKSFRMVSLVPSPLAAYRNPFSGQDRRHVVDVKAVERQA